MSPSIARPHLERLLEAVDETIFLGIREDEAVKLIDMLEPQKEIQDIVVFGRPHVSLRRRDGQDLPLGNE